VAWGLIRHLHEPNRILIVLLLACFFLAGCGQRETAVEKGIRTGTLLVGNGAEPEDLDPHTTTGIPEYKIEVALFEPLVSADPETLELVPAAAGSWDVSEDGTVYTFFLREDGRWSNGDPVTAADWVYSLRRALTPNLGNTYLNMLRVIRGADDYRNGLIDDFDMVGVAALDERTLRIELEAPIPYFLSMLCHSTFFAVHPPTIEAHGGIDRRGSGWTLPGRLVGNGAFMLADWRPNEVVRVVANPFYWDRANVSLNAVEFIPIDSIESEERSFRAGQLHVTGSIPLVKIPVYRDRGAETFRSDPYLGIYYYIFNVEKPPFDDSRVRRALSLAVDRKLLVTKVTGGGEEPAYGFYPVLCSNYDSETILREDVAEARRLLAEAGYPDGAGFPSFELLYNTSESHRMIAETIQQMWRVNLNVDARLFNQEWKVYLDSRDMGDFTVARAGWVPQYDDVSVFAQLLLGDNPNNSSRWKNDAYDDLVHRADRELDPSTRENLYQQAESILLQDMPVMPLYYYRRNYLIRPEVHGWGRNAVDHHPYTKVSLQATEEPGSP
jgi:oligopeptide transport system substrate-binding protein